MRDEALRAVDRLRTRLRRAAGEAARAAAAVPQRPRVLVLRSLRPLRTVGWWLPDQVGQGGQEGAGEAGLRQKRSWFCMQPVEPRNRLIQ